MKTLLLALIKIYQAGIAPLFGPCCRFEPSCSRYAEDAIVKKGAGRGTWLATKRLLRCHPFHQGGYDPVEE